MLRIITTKISPILGDITMNIGGDAEESGKKRIAEGLGCWVHMMCAQRRGEVLYRNRSVWLLFGPLNNFIFTHVTRHAEISICRMIYKRKK